MKLQIASITANLGSLLLRPFAPPDAPSVLPRAPPCFLSASLLRPLAPSLLPLKRPCSLSRTETAIPNPKFGVYIMYIYRFLKPKALRDLLLTKGDGGSFARAPATISLTCSPSLMLPHAPSLLALCSLLLRSLPGSHTSSIYV